ncbi:NAD(P)/FAD-dependent oxidoreductase [Alteribacter keqinensis]|uniref:FAD/NAD(P)-binding domain-containing protein n=1 Tax=Alteribacter keqinensis TaxID=2483800 RepID=A0A3M7TYD9_9BACI|nr:FAD-dependent oxidoreductase [Alteribacter keqinensis]RNA70289.1 hypothetical protein EBO34_10300 [Alteribacter keqinensis]
MKNLVLVGGGHANLSIIKKQKKESHRDKNFTLISPDPYQYYSGMFSGFAEGIYSLNDIRIDLQSFCNAHGVTFVCDTAERIESEKKQLILSNNEPLAYDALSVNAGSYVQDPVPGVSEHALSLKPNFLFPEVVDQLRYSEKPVIVGGGAAAVELAFSLTAWRDKNVPGNKGISLVTRGKF